MSQIYEDLISRLVPFALDGGYATVMAFGQTGSGKTFTMTGCTLSLIDELWKNNEANGKPRCRVQVSAIELYGPEIHDLLDVQNHKTAVREDMQGRSVFVHARIVETSSSAELKRTLENVSSSNELNPV